MSFAFTAKSGVPVKFGLSDYSMTCSLFGLMYMLLVTVTGYQCLPIMKKLELLGYCIFLLQETWLLYVYRANCWLLGCLMFLLNARSNFTSPDYGKRLFQQHRKLVNRPILEVIRLSQCFQFIQRTVIATLLLTERAEKVRQRVAL